MRPRHGAAAGGARRGRGEARAQEGAPATGASLPVPRRPRPVSAYVKISDGCDRRCSFCAIPLIKGDYETVEAAEVLRSARAALAAGARELVLVGQDTSRWAQPGWGGVSRLLGELAALEPAPLWLRLLYLQPDGIDDELLEALAAHAVPYVDVPLQHASGAVLRRMRRSGDGAAHLPCSSASGRRCRAPPCAPPSSPGSPARRTPSSRSSSPSSARPTSPSPACSSTTSRRARPPPACRAPSRAELAFERAARLGEVIDREAARFWSELAGRTVDVLVERGSLAAGRHRRRPHRPAGARRRRPYCADRRRDPARRRRARRRA